MRTPRYRVEQIAEALRASAGIYTGAASKLRCSPQTIKNYVQRHKVLQALAEEIRDATLDLAETQLVRALNDGNLTAVIFYLKTKGKERGFTERAEITGASGAAIEVIDVTRLTDEELERFARGDVAGASGASGARAPTKTQGR